MNLTKRQLGFLILFLVCASYAFQNRRTTLKPKPIDYSKFSHSTKQHQAACNSCHKIPSRSWQKASTFPDITDYPGHDSCVSCHRAQFFKGARPVICSVCHPKTSPREEARFPFRNPATNLQFTIDFPHDRHQDVIALLQKQRMRFASHADNPQLYNNCTICHGKLSVPTGVAWPDSYVPRAETFKSAPTRHDSCFNCHWKNQEPVATNCNGCHKLASSPFPLLALKRISLKFMHDGGGDKKVHVAECTTCHINITKSATSRGLKPDVPITACSECHNREGLREDVSKELIAIDRNKAFVCVYCHTSEVGSLDPPASHYLIAERPPLKRREIK
jgi:hypothetical protein